MRTIKVGFQPGSGPNAYIPLSELATITLDTGASYIYHERNQRFIPIKFSVRGRDLEGTVADAQEQITRKVKLPEGYRTNFTPEMFRSSPATAPLLSTPSINYNLYTYTPR